MSETMSTNPNEWLQFYNQNFSGQTQPPNTHSSLFSDRVSDATVVTTTVTTSSAASPTTTTTTNNHLSPEGRVTKPIRRRSRASRRTPTTLLNTDTSNFRAMVQQFTGGPSFTSSGSHQIGPGFGFGFGPRQSMINPSAVMVPQAGYHHNNLQLHHQNPTLFQQQNQQYMFGGQDGFVQRLSSNRNPNAAASEGFYMGVGGGGGGGGSSSQLARPSSSNSPNENRSNNFLF